MYEEWILALKEAADDKSVAIAVVTGGANFLLNLVRALKKIFCNFQSALIHKLLLDFEKKKKMLALPSSSLVLVRQVKFWIMEIGRLL